MYHVMPQPSVLAPPDVVADGGHDEAAAAAIQALVG